LGWFDWLWRKKQTVRRSDLSPELEAALKVPPRLVQEHDPDEPPRGDVLVLPRETPVEQLTSVMAELGLGEPEVTVASDESLGLHVLTFTERAALEAVAGRLRWVDSFSAFALLDAADPLELQFGIRAAAAYNAAGLGARLVGLQRHDDAGVRSCAQQVDRELQMARARQERTAKKSKKRR
jgi:hypothetical protein